MPWCPSVALLLSCPVAHLLAVVAETLQSIEFLFRACTDFSCRGVILSYATRRSFTVRHGKTIIVAHSSVRHDTGLVVANNTWYMMTLTYDPEVEQLSVYLVSSVTAIAAGVITPKR